MKYVSVARLWAEILTRDHSVTKQEGSPSHNDVSCDFNLFWLSKS
jgi:hypothetical protein